MNNYNINIKDSAMSMAKKTVLAISPENRQTAMKTKLTLTIQKSIIEAAKRREKTKGISLSRMFEEIFDEGGSNGIKTEPQRAAEMLLQKLEKAKSIPTKDDKELIKSHVKRKFT